MGESLFLKYIWILFIIYGIYNLFNYYKTLIRNEFDIKDRNKFYQALFIKFLLNIFPWLVMGFGTIIGNVGHFLLFFAPFTLNAYVISFGVAFVISCIAAFIWLNFLGGIEYLYESKSNTGFLVKYMHIILIILYIVVVIWAYFLIYKFGFNTNI